MRSPAVSLIAAVLASSLAVGGATGCLGHTYEIPKADLIALTSEAPEVRNQHVRVVQQFANDEAPPANRVDSSTTVVFVPVDVSAGGGSRTVGPRPRPGGGGGGLSNLAKSKVDDGRTLMILAAFVAIGLAATEGARFDGWAALHPMHPVHLYGPVGEYAVVPLAQLDQGTALWARRAVIREDEGPWRTLERAPLDRSGWTYTVLFGGAEIPSAVTDEEGGQGFQGHIQIGYYPTPIVGIQLDLGLGWRKNGVDEVVYDSRWGGELDVLPLSAGIFHAGGYGSLGLGARFEDGVEGGDRRDVVFGGGALLQLELTTHLALTGRFGLVSAYGRAASEYGLGMSIY